MATIEKLNDVTLDYIIDYCEKNNETKWLKEIGEQTVECRVYPKTRDAEGKLRVDKTKEPKIEIRKISFIQIRNAFVTKFLPDFAPNPKPKKPSMYERIAAL